MTKSNDKTTKHLIIAACFVNFFYFSLQGLFISAGSAALTGLRIWISINHKSKLWALAFILIAIISPLLLPSTDYIAAIPSIIGIIAVFWFQGFWMRVLILTGTSFWILNNYLEGAWIGFFGELFVLIVGVIKLSLWKYNNNKQQVTNIAAQ